MNPSVGSGISAKHKEPNRPASALSARPSSRNTLRPSTNPPQRPASSLSVRPPSSASTARPYSRISQRSNAKHARSKLLPFCQTLVTQVTSLASDETGADDEAFKEAVDYAVKNLESSTLNKAAVTADISVIDRQISGLTLKAKVNLQDTFAKALDTCYNRLKANLEAQENDLDQQIKASRLPDHMQFLLALSRPPKQSTLDLADAYLAEIANPPPPPKPLTWADILADDPFEGEHWEGVYGLPPGFVKSSRKDEDEELNDNQEDWGSSSSLSAWDSDRLDEGDSFSSSDYETRPTPPSSPPRTPNRTLSVESAVPSLHEQRKIVEALQSDQYWRDQWRTDANIMADFDIGDSSTLGPTLNRVLARGNAQALGVLGPERYIDEEDMVREILMALQGNRNTILYWVDNKFQTTPATPRLVHLSLASQESILSSLAKTATTLAHLRSFTATIFSNSIYRVNDAIHNRQHKVATTRTSEAFADAVDHLVRDFDAWCASQEEAIVRATAGVDEEPLIISLLSTEKAIRDAYEDTFGVVYEIIQAVFQIPDGDFVNFGLSKRSPAAQTTSLLDTLFSDVQRHIERQEQITSNALMRVFVHTAQPVWNMTGRWLQNGMGLGLGIGSGGVTGMGDELDDEFFIESSGVGVGIMSLGLLDPEFWKDGYDLRSAGEFEPQESVVGASAPRAIPLFLEHVAAMVLGAGKAVGLVRALGLSSFATLAWKSFEELVACESAGSGGARKNLGLFSVSVDTLSRLIYDELLPYCQNTGSQLVKVLIDDCGLWKHLLSIEDLFLMRKGDTISHFIDVLFAKMDSQQAWGDLHFLNTAFNDVVEANLHAGSKEWINPSLVRLSYRGARDKDKTVTRTVKSIDGLSIDYIVPFPLTYIFQPKTIQHYCEIFILLLQIRRAKSVLERILVRGERGRDERLREELKVFYAMRSRLSWFINTLLNFLTTYVIHAEISRFHEEFQKTTLFDDMIELHEDHLDKMRGRCLLKPNTSALHRAILSILDISLHFSESFMTLAGDTTTTLDVSRQSIIMKRHRSRRLKKQRRNVIGFSMSLQDEDSSDEESDEADDLGHGAREPPEPSFTGSSSMLSVDEDFFTRVERMSTELDGLVRFLRRGVESLAGGTSEAAPAFGVLAFALEDWDI